MDKNNNQLSIEHGDYEEILRQAVAVIEHARLAKPRGGIVTCSSMQLR